MKDLSIFMPIKINSERVKNKSIKKLLGRPLLNWSLETLDSIGVNIDIFTTSHNIISDSIDFESKNINILDRPKYLDDPNTLGIDIYREYSKIKNSNYYFLTHCTSPFVTKDSYLNAINICLSGAYNSGSSCNLIKSFSYFKNKKINFDKRIKTQDLEPILCENSAFYFFDNNTLLSGNRSGRNHKFIELSRIESIDLDYDEDFNFIEKINNL